MYRSWGGIHKAQLQRPDFCAVNLNSLNGNYAPNDGRRRMEELSKIGIFILLGSSLPPMVRRKIDTLMKFIVLQMQKKNKQTSKQTNKNDPKNAVPFKVQTHKSKLQGPNRALPQVFQLCYFLSVI